MTTLFTRVRRMLPALFFLICVWPCGPAAAATDPSRVVAFDIPAGAALKALKEFSAQSGQQLLYANADLAGVTTNAVKGRLTVTDALSRLLAGTQLVATRDSKNGAVAVGRASQENPGPNAPRAAPTSSDRPPPAREKLSDPEKTIELSPFMVTEDQDVGYLATNTLAGSRFKTELRDTAATISVLTTEFLGDIGATTLAQAMEYSTSAQLQMGDSSDDGPTPNGNFFQSGPAEFRVRGQPASRSRNFFTLRIEGDNYNVERIEDSRGPNSVLFGFGSPGGIVNISTKQARLDQSFRRVAVQVGSFDSHRGTVDFNQVVLPQKLSLRLNAVYDQTNNFQAHTFSRDRRFDLGAKYRITPATLLRASFERAWIRTNKGRPFITLDGGVVLWQQVGSPTFATAIAPNPALSIARLGNPRRLTYIGNTGQLIEAGTTLRTADANIAIRDRGIADPRISYGGPGQINETRATDLSVFLEQRLGRHTFIEVGYNHQDDAFTGIQPGQNNMKLFGDPNQFLRTGEANAFVGGMFMENAANSWERQRTWFRSDVVRATASTEIDAGRWGHYRLAALGEYDTRGYVRRAEREAWEGRPFNATPENAANQVRRRNYVTPGDWSTYHINSPLSTGLLRGVRDPITGMVLNSAWVPSTQAQEDDPSKQTSALLSGQARYFKGRLVIGAGSRYDRLEVLDRTGQRDPATNLWQVDRSPGAGQQVERTARNTTLGLVGHITPRLSVFYNRANNQGLRANLRIIDRNNLDRSVTAPNSKGEGQDFGFALTLLEGRLHARVTRYTTDGLELSGNYGMSGVAPESAAANILNALRTAGRITQAEQDARTPNANGVTWDMKSEGYELNLTANLTKGWRLQANYSYTDTRQTNFGPEIAAWMEREVAYYRSFNAGSLPTGQDARTIDEAIAFMLDGYQMEIDLETIGEFGLRKHKVSLFTRYDFSSGWWRGAYLGGGYRYQSRNLAGTDAARTRGFYGDPFWRADALAGYSFAKSAFRNKHRLLDRLTLQLNVSNLFDDDDDLITRLEEDGVTVRRAVVQPPRTWRLQAKLEL